MVLAPYFQEATGTETRRKATERPEQAMLPRQAQQAKPRALRGRAPPLQEQWAEPPALRL